jgi:CBS domain-containing protein
MLELAGPVSDWMVSPVVTLREETFLAEAARRFEELDVSALPVVDTSHRLMGVLSRTQLRRAGRFVRESPDQKRHLRLPEARVGEFMNSQVPVIRRELALRACARSMVKQQIHRLYVAEDGPLEGVISTRELRRAVVEARLEAPLGSVARGAFATLPANAPLRAAVARLDGQPSLTLILTREELPVGLFTESEALDAREADPEEAVELWMDPSVLGLPAELPAHLAAQQALERSARYIVTLDSVNTVKGLVSALGFAELIAGTTR